MKKINQVSRLFVDSTFIRLSTECRDKHLQVQACLEILLLSVLMVFVGAFVEFLNFVADENSDINNTTPSCIYLGIEEYLDVTEELLDTVLMASITSGDYFFCVENNLQRFY